MSKLSPKPNCEKGIKNSWEHLNSLLEFKFSCTQLDRHRNATIYLSDYDIPEDELLEELSNKGFTFEKSGDKLHIT